jgi:hypothetical protein
MFIPTYWPGRNSPDRYRLMFNHERVYKGVQNEALGSRLIRTRAGAEMLRWGTFDLSTSWAG